MTQTILGQSLRFPHGGASADAKALGLVAGGDATSGLGIGWNDGDGPAAQLRPVLLLNSGKECVHVDEQVAHRHGRACRLVMDSDTIDYAPKLLPSSLKPGIASFSSLPKSAR